MNITDEKLSAFLDAELPEPEMEFIREQLVDDENLANRLADLAMVDELLAASAATMDTRPLSDSVTRMLVDEARSSAKVLTFPLWKKIHRSLQQHSAIAAAVLLLAGFGIFQALPENAERDWKNIAHLLDTLPSGHQQAAGNKIHIKPRVTFINKSGNYCRQFDMRDRYRLTENIACHVEGQWQLTATAVQEKKLPAGDYQTATSNSLLDSEIEEMADGDFFDAEAEAVAIKNRWTK